MSTMLPNNSEKSTSVLPGPASRLLDQVRDRIRVLHYSIRTEAVYLDWIKRFIRHFDKCHPKDLGAADVAQFLTRLAVAGGVTGKLAGKRLRSTPNRAAAKNPYRAFLPRCPVRGASRSAISRSAARTSGWIRYARRIAGQTACRDPRPG